MRKTRNHTKTNLGCFVSFLSLVKQGIQSTTHRDLSQNNVAEQNITGFVISTRLRHNLPSPHIIGVQGGGVKRVGAWCLPLVWLFMYLARVAKRDCFISQHFKNASRNVANIRGLSPPTRAIANAAELWLTSPLRWPFVN